jgi:hypothetical protein
MTHKPDSWIRTKAPAEAEELERRVDQLKESARCGESDT